MSILNFPETLEVGILETDGDIVLGGYSIDTAIELQYVNVLIYKQGTHTGNERLRVKVASDVNGTRIIHTSAWSNISDISNIGDGDNWLGWLRFDFDRQGIAKNVNRYLVLEADSYTRNGDTYFIGAMRDYPFPIYADTAQSFEQAAFAATFFGYEQD